VSATGTRSDALVLFGITGDLAYRKLFAALYDLVAGGILDVPIIGVASTALAMKADDVSRLDLKIAAGPLPRHRR